MTFSTLQLCVWAGYSKGQSMLKDYLLLSIPLLFMAFLVSFLMFVAQTCREANYKIEQNYRFYEKPLKSLQR